MIFLFETKNRKKNTWQLENQGFFELPYNITMASQLSHIFAGTQALKRALPDKQAALLAEAGSSFNLGCQGPDIFYHNQRTRPLSIYYGSLLHKHSIGIFIAALAKNMILAHANAESMAFLLGFATHAALDRKTHPYIVYHSGWYDPAKPETGIYKGAHIFLERILDILLWEKTSAQAIADFRQTELLLPGEPIHPILEEALALALRTSYPRRAAKDDQLLQRIRNGFLDSAHIFALTDPSRMQTIVTRPFAFYEQGAHSIAMLYPLNVARDVDWANSGHRLWQHPCEPERCSSASYFDLVEDAIDSAVPPLAVLGELLFKPSESEAALDKKLLELSALIGQESLNIGDDRGVQKAPLWSRPLPLFPLMKQIHDKILAEANSIRL